MSVLPSLEGKGVPEEGASWDLSPPQLRSECQKRNIFMVLLGCVLLARVVSYIVYFLLVDALFWT